MLDWVALSPGWVIDCSKLGVFESSTDVDASIANNKIVLRRAAPGTIFGVVGIVVVLVSVWKGFNVELPILPTHPNDPALIAKAGAGNVSIAPDVHVAQSITTVLAALKDANSNAQETTSLSLAENVLQEFRRSLAMRALSDEEVRLYSQYKNTNPESLAALSEEDRKAVEKGRLWFDEKISN